MLDLHSPGASEGYAELAQELGGTWFLTTNNHNGVLSPTVSLEIQEGPPW